MTTSKIKIKLGAIEIEYEGSETFLKEELPQLLSAVSDLYAKSRSSFGSLQETGAATSADTLMSTSNSGVKPRLQATTASVAAKLKVDSGPELIMAAAARLTLALDMQTFPRQKIIDEMKTAAAYYKANYLKNLSASLTSLIKDGRLNEPSQGNFALTAKSLAALEPQLV